jgi:hypothetical protein
VDRAFFFTIVAMLWYFGTLPWLAVVPCSSATASS